MRGGFIYKKSCQEKSRIFLRIVSAYTPRVYVNGGGPENPVKRKVRFILRIAVNSCISKTYAKRKKRWAVSLVWHLTMPLGLVQYPHEHQLPHPRRCRRCYPVRNRNLARWPSIRPLPLRSHRRNHREHGSQRLGRCPYPCSQIAD